MNQAAQADEKEELTMTLGAYIFNLRIWRGISIDDIAARTGISRSTISKLENDRLSEPSKRVICAVADVLNIPREDLLWRAGYAAPEDLHNNHRLFDLHRLCRLYLPHFNNAA